MIIKSKKYCAAAVHALSTLIFFYSASVKAEYSPCAPNPNTQNESGDRCTRLKLRIRNAFECFGRKLTDNAIQKEILATIPKFEDIESEPLKWMKLPKYYNGTFVTVLEILENDFCQNEDSPDCIAFKNDRNTFANFNNDIYLNECTTRKKDLISPKIIHQNSSSFVDCLNNLETGLSCEDTAYRIKEAVRCFENHNPSASSRVSNNNILDMTNFMEQGVLGKFLEERARSYQITYLIAQTSDPLQLQIAFKKLKDFSNNEFILRKDCKIKNKVNQAVSLCEGLKDCYWKGSQLLKLTQDLEKIMTFKEFFNKDGFAALLEASTYASESYDESNYCSICTMKTLLEKCEKDPMKFVSEHLK